MATPAGTQGLTLPRRDNGIAKATAHPRRTAKDGLIRELYKKSAQPLWTPSFSVAFRLLILVRVCAAMYTTNTADCDEVYNYWEPLHFLLYGDGFRTWEYSSKYAIRSWAYLLLHTLPAKILSHVNPNDKRISFFTVRLAFAAISSLIEARFCRSVIEHISPRTGRYTLVFLLLSAGMYNAATTFLPSTFSMYFVTLGWSYALEPVSASSQRTLRATSCFAIAAVVGWPFSILLAVPFVLEEVLLKGQAVGYSFATRLVRLLRASYFGFLALGAVTLIDSYFYGRFVLVSLNIVKYNVLSSSGGPDLYGVEPWYYYILNGLLNFNVVFLLALMSFPAMVLTALLIPKKLGVSQPGQTRSTVLLGNRLLPFYTWFGILTMQAHKEERFMFPAFPLICFQAAVTLALSRGLLEEVYVKTTKAPFKAARTSLFKFATGTVLVGSSLISVARVLAISHSFRAPMPLLYHLQYHELPALAIYNYPSRYPKLNLTNFATSEERIDISVLEAKNLTLCYGKEWYRFPSSFLVPEEIRTEFIKSDFSAILPKHFAERRSDVRANKQSPLRRKQVAALSPPGFNDQNIEELDRYVPVKSCSYLVDLDFPHRYQGNEAENSGNEPRYAIDSDEWQRVVCHPFLDAQHSSRQSRSFRLPFVPDGNVYGDYCLLRNKKLQ